MAQIEPVVITVKLKPRERYVYIAIIIALLLITFIQHNAIRKARQKDVDFNEWLKQKEAEIDSAKVQASQIAAERDKYVKTATASQNDFKAQIRALRKKLSANTPKVDFGGPLPADVEIIGDPFVSWTGTIPQWDSLTSGCLTKDTLLQVQDSLIFSLEGQVVTITDSFKKELTLSAEQLQGQKEISDVAIQEWEKDKAKLKKTERKLRRQKAFTRIVGGVAFALSLGLIATSQ